MFCRAMERVTSSSNTHAVLCITNSKGSGGPDLLHCQGGSGEKSGYLVCGEGMFCRALGMVTASRPMLCSASPTARVPVIPTSSTVKGKVWKPKRNRLWEGPTVLAHGEGGRGLEDHCGAPHHQQQGFQWSCLPPLSRGEWGEIRVPGLW